MIEPKEIEIDGKKFIISKFPAVAGREIIARYAGSGIPIIGNYAVNKEIMLKMMCYVAIKIEGNDQPLKLTTESLIDNHTGNWETLGKIEIAMMEYNCNFFQNGRISTFFDDLAQKLPEKILKMWTVLSQQLSQKEKPPYTN